MVPPIFGVFNNVLIYRIKFNTEHISLKHNFNKYIDNYLKNILIAKQSDMNIFNVRNTTQFNFKFAKTKFLVTKYFKKSSAEGRSKIARLFCYIFYIKKILVLSKINVDN